jgi:hypothetical protein
MPPERRARTRSPITSAYLVNILSPSGAVLGVAVPVDVSQVGFRADTSRDYPQGESLRLELCGPQHHRSLLPFVVVWSAKYAGGWQLGGLFTQELTGEEAERLAAG